MEAVDLRELVRFSADGPQKQTLFESDLVWAELVCLDRVQETGPMGDPDSDAIITVVAGEVVVFVEGEHTRLEQWGSVLAPAGTQVVVRNASAEPAVVLIFAAPPPG